MRSLPTDRAGLEILPFGDCVRLLDSVPVGRIGFFAHGEVVILPVNFLLDGQDVVFKTAEGSKLSAVGSRQPVGFEADSYDSRTRSGWSVVVTGFTEVVDSDDEVDRFEDLGLDTWASDAPGRTWVRIRPTSVTGRRTSGASFSA